MTHDQALDTIGRMPARVAAFKLTGTSLEVSFWPEAPTPLPNRPGSSGEGPGPSQFVSDADLVLDPPEMIQDPIEVL